MDKRVYNLQNKQLIKLYSQVCVLPGEWVGDMVTTWDGQESV